MNIKQRSQKTVTLLKKRGPLVGSIAALTVHLYVREQTQNRCCGDVGEEQCFFLQDPAEPTLARQSSLSVPQTTLVRFLQFSWVASTLFCLVALVDFKSQSICYDQQNHSVLQDHAWEYDLIYFTTSYLNQRYKKSNIPREW